MQELSISRDQAQTIVDEHLDNEQLTIVNLVELSNHGYSHLYDMKTYIVDFAESGSASALSCFLTIERPAPTHSSGPYPIHRLLLIAKLLNLIRKQTNIPIPESILDNSLSLIPFHVLITPPAPHHSTSIVSLAAARASGNLSSQSRIYIDLILGSLLAQLHTGVQNDWYGSPILEDTQIPPVSTGYSWQETFTELLENLLHEVEENEAVYGVPNLLPFASIRSYLSHAIASFLFDDVEVPSLVWFTGFEEDIYIALPPSSAADNNLGTVVAILPNIAHALWGDPLLETFMMGSLSAPEHVAKGQGPSDAFMEGYVGGGGKPVLIFPRQRTKRIWYTVFLALFVLTKYGKPAPESEGWVMEKMEWARKTLLACVSALKDAPCS